MTLTYNQKKSFTTIPGGICSIISAGFLLYYFALNVSLFFMDARYEKTELRRTIDHINPEVYEVDLRRFGLASKLSSTDATV